MKRWLTEILYDIKMMGANFFLPLMLFPLLFMIGCIAHFLCRVTEFTNIFSISILECYMPAIAALWFVFAQQPILEAPGGNLLLTYSYSRRYWGCIRCIRFYLFYAAASALVCLGMGAVMHTNFFPGQYLLYLAQGWFIGNLGFLGMMLFRKSNEALVLVAVYTCAMLIMIQPEWTNISPTQYLSIYIGRTPQPAVLERALPMIIRSLAGGSLFLFLGQVRYRFI